MFDNCLKGANNHLGQAVDRNEEEPFKLWSFDFDAKPKKGVHMNHNWTKSQTWNGDGYEHSEETASEVSFKHGDTTVSVQAASDHWGIGVEGDLLDADWKVEGAANYESKPADNAWSAAVSADIKSPEMSGVKAFMNLHIEQSHEGKEDKTELEAKVNIKHADLFVGVAVNHDMTTWKSVRAQAVMKDGMNKYFARCNVMDKHASVGCTQRYKEKGFAHSYEAFFLWAKDAKGFMNQPICFQAGGKYQLSKKARMSYTVEASDAWQAHAHYWYKLNKHWRVAGHQHFDTARLCDSARNPYDLGFEITYKL